MPASCVQPRNSGRDGHKPCLCPRELSYPSNPTSMGWTGTQFHLHSPSRHTVLSPSTKICNGNCPNLSDCDSDNSAVYSIRRHEAVVDDDDQVCGHVPDHGGDKQITSSTSKRELVLSNKRKRTKLPGTTSENNLVEYRRMWTTRTRTYECWKSTMQADDLQMILSW